MTIVVEVEGLEDAVRVLGRDVIGVLEPVFRRSVVRMEGAMKAYPPPPGSGVWAASTDRRQKAGFFAALRAGRTTGSRTGTLGRRWTHRVVREGEGLWAETGNNTVYGPWVQASAAQVGVHRGRWATDVQVADAEMPQVVADATRAVRAAMGGGG